MRKDFEEAPGSGKATAEDHRAPIEPVLKWPGGKSLLVSKLLQTIPKTNGCYFEPFVGSAALFFSLRPRIAVLGDLNNDLITFYQTLRGRPSLLYDQISQLKNERSEYYAIRAKAPRSQIDIATRLFYLNKTCFNGLYRTNLTGTFNVPFGNNGRSVLPEKHRFVEASKALCDAVLVTNDFEDTCCDAKAGDIVYFDPPYTVAHNNNGFIKYNARLFSWADQVRLSEFTRQFVNRNVTVVMTNADHTSIRELYRDYSLHQIERHSSLSASPRGRKKVSELLITSNC